MVNHPDFFNLRRMALVLAAGPIGLLLLITLLDFSWHQFRTSQAVDQCERAIQATAIQTDQPSCPP